MHDVAPHLFSDQRGGGAMGGGGGGRADTSHSEPRHPGHVGRDHGEPGEHNHDHQLVRGVAHNKAKREVTIFKSI